MANEQKKKRHRKSGILLHPTAFPSPYGMGDMGSAAFDFMDFLDQSGQKLWQVLPLGPTGYGDSPYQAFSSFAGQPLIISPEMLHKQGLLDETDLRDIPAWDPVAIDYGPAIEYKFSLLRKAHAHFVHKNNQALHNAYQQFCNDQKDWLEDYALFMSVKDAHGGVIWTSWAPEIAFPTPGVKDKWRLKLSDSVDFYRFIQFIFFGQWFALKKYANSKGISIIGDIPIFVAFDSADVWANKDLYELDSKGFPTYVAGVPPDYFSETGQLWGNPLYKWSAHQATGYTWWIERVRQGLKLVDILRIDHFRGFEAYWAIPYGSPTAINGQWVKGPFKDFFYAMEAALGKDLPIIAEDLGIITPEVEDLRDSFHFPGMRILQFAFEDLEDNDFLPHNFITNTICYSGTHDNDTTVGWYLKTAPESQDKVRRYMNTDANDIAWDFIRTCFGSAARMAVVPLQDVLSLDSWARTNTPGTPANNWKWRYTPNMLTPSLIERLKAVSELYGR